MDWSHVVFRFACASRVLPCMGALTLRSCSVLGYAALANGFAAELGLLVMKRFLSAAEKKYKGEPTYHNSTHAADVTQATAFFLSVWE